jgi:hypothetical protein
MENNWFTRVAIVPYNIRNLFSTFWKECISCHVPLLSADFLYFIQREQTIPPIEQLSNYSYWLPNTNMFITSAGHQSKKRKVISNQDIRPKKNKKHL